MLSNKASTPQTDIFPESTSEGYVDTLFANRLEENKILKAKIEQGQAGKIERSLLEIYAVKGQGKSWLLQRIFNLFAFPGMASSNKEYTKPPLTARFDFNDLVEKPLYFHYFAIIKILTLELIHQSGQSFKVPHLEDERAPNPKELDKMVNAFLDLSRKITDTFVPIIICDTTDHAEDQVLEWLEEKVLFPLIQRDQIIFIFGGRRKLFWKFFEVRRRVHAYELPPLTEEGSAEQLKLRGQNPRVGELLFHYSKGHPEINWRILYGLQHDRKISHPDQASVEANHSYILERVKEITDSQFLSTLGKEAHTLLWDVCILRRFNTASLRHFVELKNEKSKKRSEGDYLDLIQQMLDAALVHWESDKGGYVLDTTIRAVMVDNLNGRDRNGFVELQLHALDLYKRWVKDYPDNAKYYLLEIVYHEGELLGSGELQDDELLKRLQQVLDDPKLPGIALEETEFPELLQKDEELGRGLFKLFPGLREEILSRVESIREKKSNA